MIQQTAQRKVEIVIGKSKHFGAELRELRRIVLETGLTEDFKWRAPCYTFEGANVAIIGADKTGAAISFLKGALLKDAAGILRKITETMQAERLIRFTSVEEVLRLKGTIKAYIDEAIANERAGLKIEYKKTEDFAVPEELTAAFAADPALKAAFAGLTPGRQRGYLLHFAGAKQAKTRVARIEKCAERIMSGKGLQD